MRKPRRKRTGRGDQSCSGILSETMKPEEMNQEVEAYMKLQSGVTGLNCEQRVVAGKWFMAEYGFEMVIGRCRDVLPTGLVLEFRWGGPFREPKFVEYQSILGEVKDPTILGKIKSFFSR